MNNGAVRAAARAARGRKVIVVTRRAFDQAMAHPQYGGTVRGLVSKLETQGRKFEHVHSGVELVNLVVQVEEWPLELLGAFQMKGIGAAADVATTRRLADKGMLEGIQQFGEEISRPQTGEFTGEPGTGIPPTATTATGEEGGEEPGEEGGETGATTMGTDPLGQITGQTAAGTGAGEGATGGTTAATTQTGAPAHAQIMGQAATAEEPGEAGTETGETGTEVTGKMTLQEAQEALPDVLTPEFVGDAERFASTPTGLLGPSKERINQRGEYLFEVEANDNGNAVVAVYRKNYDETGGDEVLLGRIETTADDAGVITGRSITPAEDVDQKFNSLEELLTYTAPNPGISATNPVLIDKTGDGKTGSSMRFNLPFSSGGVHVTVTNSGKNKFTVAIDAPGFEIQEFETDAKSILPTNTTKLTKRRALTAIDTVINYEQLLKDGWERNPKRRPLLSRRVDVMESEQVILNKMPRPLVYRKEDGKVKNIFTDDNVNGMAMESPALDPGMRIKVQYTGDDNYSVYLESDSFADEFGNYYGRQETDNPPMWDIEQYAQKSPGGRPAIAIANVDALSLHEAVERVLADMLPDDIWDNMVQDPETGQYSLVRKGVPGNQPAPLPENVTVRANQEAPGHGLQFDVLDADGNVIEDYKVALGENDQSVFKFTMSFPNHPDIAPLETMTHMSTKSMTTPEQAALMGIRRLRQKKWGEGGIATSIEPTYATSAVKANELLEDADPIIPSSEQSFGKMTIDKVAEEHEHSLSSQDGKIAGARLYKRIYKFSGRNTPKIYVRETTQLYEGEWYVIEMRYPRRNAAVTYVSKSMAKDIREATNMGIRQIEESDHEFKPLHRPGLFFELDQIQNAVNQRQFETNTHVERRIRGTFQNMRHGHAIDIRGYTIGSLKELALLGQLFRHPGMEAKRFVYLDKNMQIVGHDFVSMGAPGMTPNLDQNAIRESMDRVGASYFMGLHNHPGGNTDFSPGDMDNHSNKRNDFGDKYLGDVVVDSGRYSQAVNMGKQMARSQNVPLTAEELGWDPGQGAAYYTDPTTGESTIHPNDPMYQYDLESPHAPLNDLMQNIAEGGVLNIKNQGADAVRKVVRLGKYLQTEENWTTIFFKGYDNGVRAAVDYKDLHLLSPSKLFDFIRGESVRWGGERVNVYVGEGDWYSTKKEVEQSSWGEIIQRGSGNPIDNVNADKYGIELAWFAGLKDNTESGIMKDRVQTRMIPMYYTDARIETLTGGMVRERQIDSEQAATTGLMADTPERKTLIERIRNTIKGGGHIDSVKAYLELFQGDIAISDSNLKAWARQNTVQSFIQAIINRHILTRSINPQAAASPQESADEYAELANIESRIHTKSYTINDKTTWSKMPDRRAVDSPTAYAAARLAAIGKDDIVLTLDDTDGTLATFAATSKADTIITSTTDSFVAGLFRNVLKNIVDKVEGIEPENLAREYKGKRPTVILLNAQSSSAQKIDEAMKVLAPGGRLVCVMKTSGDYKTNTSKNLQTGTREPTKAFLEQMGDEYFVRGSIGNTERAINYYIIDKVEPIMPSHFYLHKEPDWNFKFDADNPNYTSSFFQYAEKVRADRRPVKKDMKFEGVGLDEHVFDQWIANPPAPTDLAVSPDELSETDAGAAAMSAQDADGAGMLADTEDADRQEADNEASVTVEENTDGIPVQRISARTVPEHSQDLYGVRKGAADEALGRGRTRGALDNEQIEEWDEDPNVYYKINVRHSYLREVYRTAYTSLGSAIAANDSNIPPSWTYDERLKKKHYTVDVMDDRMGEPVKITTLPGDFLLRDRLGKRPVSRNKVPKMEPNTKDTVEGIVRDVRGRQEAALLYRYGPAPDDPASEWWHTDRMWGEIDPSWFKNLRNENNADFVRIEIDTTGKVDPRLSAEHQYQIYGRSNQQETPGGPPIYGPTGKRITGGLEFWWTAKGWRDRGESLYDQLLEEGYELKLRRTDVIEDALYFDEFQVAEDPSQTSIDSLFNEAPLEDAADPMPTVSPPQPVRRPGFAERFKDRFRPEGGFYNIVTAKRTLERMGTPGKALLASLKGIRDFGDSLTGYGHTVLDDMHGEWKKFVRESAKKTGMSITDAANHWNEVLVRHQEGKSQAAVPPIVKKIVAQTTGFFQEHVVAPMFDMNKSILNQGRLFEMPESLVDDGILTNDYRSELEQGAPGFDKFMRQMSAQPGNGVVHGIVRNNRTGEVLAVRVKGNVFLDAMTGTIQPLKDSVRYELLTVHGQVREGTPAVLDGTHPDYSTIGTRHPHKKRWENRERAKSAWNQHVSDNPRQDILGEYFAQKGIQLPEGVTFRKHGKGNIEEWSVRAEGAELYRIRRIVPYQKGKSKKETAESHSFYDEFKNKLLVYDAGQVRDPIFINRQDTPHRLWEPIANYFPHMIDWRMISVEPKDGWRYERFLDFAKQMSEIPENGLTYEQAIDYIKRRALEAKTRSYGNMEQDRIHHYPVYQRQYFQVWGQYLSRSAHRLETIRQFGQKNDLLNAQLMQFLSEEHLTEDYQPSERAVLKLRFGKGHMDFLHEESESGSPFRDKNTGKPLSIDPLDPEHGNFDHMSPRDWQALVEDGLVIAHDDGTYTPTAAGVTVLEVPAFINGALKKGIEQMTVAQDAVTNQLGWRQGDMLDERFNSAINRFRTFTGLLFLGRAWASNLAQTVNPAVAFGIHRVLKSYYDLANPKTKKHEWRWAKEIGAFAIDVMHDYSGSATWERRSLRQMLGAVPEYQIANRRDAPFRAFSPGHESIEDPGVRTSGWTPFYTIERFNRASSAIAAKYYAVGKLKRMIEDPKSAAVGRAQLTEIPQAPGLPASLDAVMNIKSLTAADIDSVSGKLRDEVREDMPHLYPVYEFLSMFGKEGADWMQHRVEAMDRGRLWSTNPIVLLLAHLQSFNIAQTKMLKDLIVRDWRIAHTVLNHKSDRPLDGVRRYAKALGGLSILPKMLLYGGAYGFASNLLGDIIRFQTPNEKDQEWMVWLIKAGMFSMIGDMIWQLHHYPRASYEITLGPGLGTVADVTADAFAGNANTLMGIARPPTAGPSVKQIVDGFENDSGLRRRRVK